jgi:hypothetical protein
MTSRRLLLVVLVVATVFGSAVAPVAVAQPQPPASYYGSVEIGGDPAPAGVTIQAVVDGTVVGEITTEEAGQYGGESTWEEKLTADCAAADVSCESGSTTVSFELAGSGVEADQTATWESTAVERVDLTFPATEVSPETPTPTQSPDSTSTPAGTATPTESSSSSGDGGGGGGGGGGQASGDSGEVEVTDRTLLNESVVAGGEAVVAVDLVNYDPVDGDVALELAVDGTVVTDRTYGVSASSDRTVYLRTRLNSPGTYEVAVDGESLGTVEVTAATGTPTAGSGSTTSTTGSGSATTATPTATPASTDTPTASARPPTPDGSGGTPVEQIVGIAAGVGMVTLALLSRLL